MGLRREVDVHLLFYIISDDPVAGHPARDASQNFCEVLEVTLPDGKTIKP